MSTGNWFKSHRKQVITHTLIVAAFLLFLLFLAEPLFDRFERVAGESVLCRATLPATTNNIQYWVDQYQVTTSAMDINGWAFIEGYDSLDSEICIVLKSNDGRTYVFTTEIVLREGVTQYFKELGLNLDYSGFTALIPTRKVANGEYAVGIYIRKGDTEALQYTGKVVEF